MKAAVIGRNGVEDIAEGEMTPEEKKDFLASVDVIRQAAESAGIVMKGNC